MSAAASVRETASMFRALADHAGPYTRKGQYEVTGERLGLTPRRSLRLAHGQWKQVPAHIADAVRALYTETCEALDDKAASLNEETHAAIEERRRRCEGVDGERACPARATDRSAEAETVND
ncbi:MAG: hypothetical protein KF895_03145 [Parvibaculum sp.]|nr:hypothetical protein [Parvibaculum sp.]